MLFSIFSGTCIYIIKYENYLLNRAGYGCSAVIFWTCDVCTTQFIYCDSDTLLFFRTQYISQREVIHQPLSHPQQFTTQDCKNALPCIIGKSTRWANPPDLVHFPTGVLVKIDSNKLH